MRNEYNFSNAKRGPISQMFRRRRVQRRLMRCIKVGFDVPFIILGILTLHTLELIFFVIGILITIPYCLYHWTKAVVKFVRRR